MGGVGEGGLDVEVTESRVGGLLKTEGIGDEVDCLGRVGRETGGLGVG